MTKSQINLSAREQRYLIISLLVTFFVWFIPYSFGENIAVFTNDLVYIPLSLFLVMVSFYRLIESKKGLRIVWTMFLVSAIAQLVAQHIWSLDELILDTKPFPSYADVAFLISYLMWIPFFITYLKPLKNLISRKILVLSIIISCTIIVPSSYYLIQSAAGTYTIENTLLSSYVIIDGINFIPVSICITLFFKGKINFFPSLMFFAMIPELIADVLFQITSSNNTYYSGSLSDLFFYFTFVLFMFGSYSSHQLGKKQDLGVKSI